jgi:hypothetical protein
LFGRQRPSDDQQQDQGARRDVFVRYFPRAARAAFALPLCAVTGAAALAQPLPSWNEGPAKARILAFVQAVTDKSGKDFDANAKGPTVVGMKTDWKRIVPVE